MIPRPQGRGIVRGTTLFTVASPPTASAGADRQTRSHRLTRVPSADTTCLTGTTAGAYSSLSRTPPAGLSAPELGGGIRPLARETSQPWASSLCGGAAYSAPSSLCPWLYETSYLLSTNRGLYNDMCGVR